MEDISSENVRESAKSVSRGSANILMPLTILINNQNKWTATSKW